MQNPNTQNKSEEKKAGSSRQRCIYCGNNPTNHAFSFFAQTFLIPLSPLTTLFAKVQNKFIDSIAKTIMTPYIWAFVRIGLWGINKDPEKAHTERSKVIWEEAKKRGIEMEELVVFGKPVEQYRAKINGKWHYFESIPIPYNFDTSSYSWMDDKWLLKKFLRKKKIPVAFGRSVATIDAVKRVFKEGHPPFITKPRLGSRGRHTITHIYNEIDLIDAYKISHKLCAFVIIEEQLFGSVYRGTYINGRVVGILRGDPPRITGDGKSNIKELIEKKNTSKHPKVKDVLITPMLKDFIGRQGFTLNSVIENEKVVDLSEKIGINYGGFAEEMLPETHPKIIEYIKQAGDALGAPVVGFDFIIEDVTRDPDAQRWGIIEANSLPFINLHHFPLKGDPINVASYVWDLWK